MTREEEDDMISEEEGRGGHRARGGSLEKESQGVLGIFFEGSEPSSSNSAVHHAMVTGESHGHHRGNLRR
jgi:hypothetical protein